MADFVPPDERRSTAGGAGGSHPVEARPRHSGTAGDSQPHPPAGGTPDTSWRPSRQAYAAIDLGTNNCRLLIARPHEGNFVVIDAFSRVVRLGEGLAQTGRLSDEAMDRAVGALKVCADKLKRRNVRLARSVVTDACP